MNPLKRKLVAGAFVAAGLSTGLALAATPAGAAPADGRCVAQGAGFTFDGPTKAAVAKGGLMSFVIRDHAFNGADATEDLLDLSICS